MASEISWAFLDHGQVVAGGADLLEPVLRGRHLAIVIGLLRR
jgi:hypothetical protein